MTKHVAYLQVVPKLEIVHLRDSNRFFLLGGLKERIPKKGELIATKIPSCGYIYNIHHIYTIWLKLYYMQIYINQLYMY